MFYVGFGFINVDILGCRLLLIDIVKYFVSLCGFSLISINFVYIGVNCMVLLYLVGLNIDKVVRIMYNVVVIDFVSILN